MIQPISSVNFKNNINFEGNLSIRTRNNGSDLNTVYNLISDPEKDEFKAQIEDFKEFVENNTGEDNEFTLVLDQDDWFVAGGPLVRGKSVIFEVVEGSGINGRRMFGGEIPMTRPNGELWHKDKAFSTQLAKFLRTAKEEVLGKYLLWKAIEDARKPRNPRPIYPKNSFEAEA